MAAYTEIGDAFTTEYPEAKVTFNFASSSDLVTQINEGSPADVYASADQANMTEHMSSSPTRHRGDRSP